MQSIDEILEQRKKIVKTNIVYMNNEGQVVTKEKATKVVITEYDKDGKILNEIWGQCNVNTKEEEEER